MFNQVLNTSLINCRSVFTLKSMLFFELLSFSFSLKGTLTLLKQCAAKRKMISEDSITDTVKRASKKLQEDCVLRSQET